MNRTKDAHNSEVVMCLKNTEVTDLYFVHKAKTIGHVKLEGILCVHWYLCILTHIC